MNRISDTILVILLTFSVTTCPVLAEQTKSIVVTTSMLESAVREIIPSSEDIEIIRLLPPSSCPGHFDLSPRLVPKLRSAVMVLRHDYQGVLDKKISAIGVKNTSLIEITTDGSPLIPSNYFTLVNRIRTQFSSMFLRYDQELLSRAASIEKQTSELAVSLQKRAVQWKGQPIIAAEHQKESCEWLGFEIAGVLKRPEDTSPRDMEKLLAIKAVIIVANLQEGVQGAQTLGERMNIPVAVLSNFPDVEGFGTDYFQLAKENMRRLEAAWQKR